MAKTEKINNILKHKRIIFFSLVLFGLVLLIVLIYVLTYVNNKPKPFSTDEKVKITNKSDCFDFNIEAVKIALKGDKP